MLDYIFLDLDGPIFEGNKRHYHCYRDIIEQYGGDVLDINTYWDMKRSKISRDILLERSNFHGTYKIFFDEWMKNIENEKYLSLDTLKPNVIETLGTWKKLAKSIVLITMRQNRDLLIQQLMYFNLYSLFDEIIDCPPQRENTKYEALKNRTFNNAIFIGDTEEDIKTARMLNIKSIGITNGLRKKEFLHADYYYEEIQDIDFRTLECR
ncbi:HAD family hydrolase [Sulfurospirillum sp.]|uniref:HAD family hydrolase n=1 Tax=Sulfurospirillum sp. TaxID=2053622 RepID=UPI002FDCC395